MVKLSYKKNERKNAALQDRQLTRLPFQELTN